MNGMIEKLGKYKYLLLVLFVGLILILLPSRTSSDIIDASISQSAATGEEARLEKVLGDICNVGEVSVLRSEEGVVVVCEGAASPQVRLDVLNAVMAYSGLSSDRITVLKMKTT
ncbi:MAG TPA: hypothetical protein DD735_05595 [Clostridiales bacterium]|nr:hypothetical protein [Clostridiales bacterium]